ncbi:uncharacterized protein NECHADRAFT_52208 [Fusarium vanettenii 77-13-4]|uniref:Uncharacterized protein n=1 Tax=Fusarium vanettenii (strain ATCC MYA-4622 / CBS 123669 / FGSC 9596 / NRRL 45880 / 77-13-4) TaxID=660122 RepID=C7ZG27_FUSV7|nr:uncharacterized protein NECHADRAFT_52208 [Fusarium vanettenii 77-13-4]EEU37079.1 hypothetical protein NECHADRAFT_52208 [Fusarium vanettenii 77-13-4]
MPEYDYKFRTITEYNYTHPTPTLWQAWHEAYFRRVGGAIYANGEYVRLYESGCKTDSWTAPNCTRTCSNNTYMFSSPENVWNCITLAEVSMEVGPGNKTVDPVNFKQMDDKFDLGGSLESFHELFVLLRVRRCFWQSCSDSKYGKCTLDLECFRCNPVDPGNIQDFDRAINHAYCRDADLGVDSDIAGPGILVAYMAQIALVLLLAGLFWATYLPWNRPKTATRQFLGAFDSTSTPKTGPEISKPVNRLTLAAHSTISELQEAQTAFGLAVGVIFLCAFGGGSGLGLANFSSVLSYSVNHDIAFGLLVVGACSIAFLQPCRQRVGKHIKPRWVFMVPMLTSWGLMIIAHGLKTQGSWADPEHLIEILRENAAVEDCGNHPGPMSFCLGPLLQGPDESQRVFKITIMLAPIVHILFAIALFEEWAIKSRENPESNISQSFSGRASQILPRIFFTANLLSLSMLIICLAEVVKAFKKI